MIQPADDKGIDLTDNDDDDGMTPPSKVSEEVRGYVLVFAFSKLFLYLFF